MNISFYNGASGLIAYQNAMTQVSNNIANVNTVGYKPTRPEFESLLYTEMYTNEVQPRRGHGVKMSSADLLYGQGPMEQTSINLDFMLLSDGFFALEDPSALYGTTGSTLDGTADTGEQAAQPGRIYTRNGSFDISLHYGEDGTTVQGYLVDSQGRFVLTTEGQRIQLSLKEDGTFDLSDLKDRIGVFNFKNPYGLESVNNTSFRETAVSGEATPMFGGYTLRQNALERSGVSLADEMTNMIVMQRAYQLSARMVQTADQMEEIVNNLR